VVKLVYTTDSKSVAARRGGSSPPTGTTNSKNPNVNAFGFFIVCRKVVAQGLRGR
jgi:hypothetical protein